MKKVKIMLAVIAVLATAGGVLAFRISESKRFIQICTRPILSGEVCQVVPCLNPPVPRKFLDVRPFNVCYYSLPPGHNCNEFLCTFKGFTAPQ
jgi:hypothetical protein